MTAATDGGSQDGEGSATAEERALLELYRALPDSERLALMVDLLRRREAIRPCEAIGQGQRRAAEPEQPRALVAHWANAIAEHQLGQPERLARLLEKCTPLVGAAGAHLAQFVTQHATRAVRGRPRKASAPLHILIENFMVSHYVRVQFVRRREELKLLPEEQRSGTPTRLAEEEVAARFNLSVATLQRIVKGRGPARPRKSRNF